jgi:hypothetical protein
MFGERQIQTLLGPADPARGVTVPPPPCSARELIARAERHATAGAVTRPEPPAVRVRARHARPTRRLVLVGAVAAIAAGATATIVVWRDGPATTTGARGQAALGPVLVPLAYQYETDPPPAGDHLRALAGQVAATSYDTHPGRYAYHDYKTWGATVMTSAEGYEINYVEERRVWIASDGSGRVRSTQLAPEFPDVASRDYWQHNPGELGPKTPARPYDDLPAGMAGPGQPLTSDRAALSEGLSVDQGAGATAKRVMDKYMAYIVPRPARVQILDILADLPGFVWRGQVTDRAGRAGVAISADDPENDVQMILIFNPRTGELYAQEMIMLRERRVAEYALFLSYAYADQLG